MFDRRDFMKSMSSLSAAMMASNIGFAAEAKSDKWGQWLPTRTLGKTGEAVTMLGMGGYHFCACEEKESEKIIETAMAGGVRFFDNAQSYFDGGAEERMGKLLVPKYRDEVFIMTKTTMTTAKEARQHLEGSLRRLKTDHLDLWQVHAVDSPDDVDDRFTNGVIDEFIKAKEEGKTRYIGFTGHRNYKAHLHILERTKDLDDFATCQMPVNLLDPSYASFIQNVMPKLVERNFGILAMKSLSIGNFFKTSSKTGASVIPDRVTVKQAIEFVWSHPVSVLISGADSAEVMQEKIDIAKSFKPMDEAQRLALIEKVADFAGNETENYKA